MTAPPRLHRIEGRWWLADTDIFFVRDIHGRWLIEEAASVSRGPRTSVRVTGDSRVWLTANNLADLRFDRLRDAARCAAAHEPPATAHTPPKLRRRPDGSYRAGRWAIHRQLNGPGWYIVDDSLYERQSQPVSMSYSEHDQWRWRRIEAHTLQHALRVIVRLDRARSWRQHLS